MPIEVIAAIFFVLIALVFVGPGQVLGRSFDGYPSRIMGYTLKIGGSLAGIAAFSLISWLGSPPWIWFLIVCAGVAWLLHEAGELSWPRILALLGVVCAVQAPSLRAARQGVRTFWSPYYAVEYSPSNLAITVDTIGHQQMTPFDVGGSSYSLIHHLQRAAGRAPFGDVLIIGAGSGNDIDHALRHGAQRIDAVEIDPAIQNIGMADNPDRPYADIPDTASNGPSSFHRGGNTISEPAVV